jgi:hypothetical protein
VFYCKQVKPVSSNCIYDVVHHLYFKAGLLVSSPRSCKDYNLRIHSVRKFFRTEISAHGIERDYIEFMMGHKVCNYHDIKMKGVEYLRGVYLTSGIAIQPKIRLNKIDVLKEIMCAWGLNPEEILTRKALEQSQATTMDQNQSKNQPAVSPRHLRSRQNLQANSQKPARTADLISAS